MGALAFIPSLSLFFYIFQEKLWASFRMIRYRMVDPLVLGIDIEFEGARVVLADTAGHVLADARQDYARGAIPGLPAGYLEQSPDDWWEAVRACLRKVIAESRRQGHNLERIVAGAVASTSGTVVLLDDDHHPLRPALMHVDQRAQAEAEEVNAESAALRRKLGYRFDASFTLPKLIWLARHEPEVWKKTRHVAHAGDYLVGKITGVFDITDQNSALKTGFDLLDFTWPSFIESRFGIDRTRLPQVIRSGETIGRVSKECAEETGLAETTRIVAGMTGKGACQIASGARHVGDWNTLLNTPLVIKGLSKRLLVDPLGRVYCHLHPMGYWMPSSASNVGAGVLDERFPNIHKADLGRTAFSAVPTGLLIYPLRGKGELLPFDYLDAEGFVEGEAQSEQELYTAHLEGFAYVERLTYGILSALGAEIRERIYTTGVGAENLEWMQIRADVMGMECARAMNANAAMGSAIVAASRTHFRNIVDASAQMIHLDRVINPRPQMVARYTDSYQSFLDACRRHGYTSKLGQSPQQDFSDTDDLNK
jgi:sugar (pentulose or hexulose) kinase